MGHMELEVEIKALAKETDKASTDRAKDAREELSNLNDKLQPLRASYDQEKSLISEVQGARQKMQSLISKMQLAEARGDVETMSDLKYDAIPGLRTRLQGLEDRKLRGLSLLREVVTADDISDVVSRW